jgi:Polyketide cyclase / dehydrase and lipid transport
VSTAPRTAVRVELAHRFAVGLREGFDYITDLRNWPDYWPDLVRVEPDSRWREPRDRARLVLRLLGRETEMTMTLERIETCRLVEYTSVQHGLPDARHERHFVDDGHGGLHYRLVVEYAPRLGAHGLFDRVLLKPAVERALRATVSNLEAMFASSIGPTARS